MSFSLKLKEYREKSGYTQKDLAKKLNVSISSVGMWESTSQIPTAKKLIEIANLFNISLDELLDRNKGDIIKRPPYDITDKQLLDLIKLYGVMNDIQKAQVLGYIVGLLEQAGINVKSVLGY